MTTKAPLLNSDNVTIGTYTYDLQNDKEDEELKELVEIAAAICDAPIAMISVCDSDKFTFLAKKGTSLDSVSVEDSFCFHTLNIKESILTIPDTLEDEQWKGNPFVIGEPFIRFYCGAVLTTPEGRRIGTLCVLDTKPKELSQEKERALELIARKLIRYLERRKQLTFQNKQIEFDQKRLRYLTDNVPGAIFQLDYHHAENRYAFSFTSAGISSLHPALKPNQLKEDPFLLSDLVHPDDRESFHNSIGAAIRDLKPWQREFRMVGNNIHTWIRGTAVPRRHKDVTEWYGVFENIDYLKEYQLTLEDIAFDISHGLRKPVSNLLGLLDLFEDDQRSPGDKDNFKKYVKIVSEELEKFTKQLNESYSKKKVDFQERLSQTKNLK